MATFLQAPLLPGGIHIGGQTRYSNVPFGDQPLVAMGQDVLITQAQLYVTSIFVPRAITISKVGYLVGSVGSLGFVHVRLWSYRGTVDQLLRFSPTGTTNAVASANTIQLLTLNAVTRMQGPGLFWLGFAFSDARASIKMIAGSNYVTPMTNSYSGGTWSGTVFASMPNPADTALPSTFVANVGPFCFVQEE